MGERYIHAVSITGYKSAISGKNTAKVEMVNATPNEKANKKIMKTGNNNAEGRNGTLVTIKMTARGTKDKTKLTMLAKIVEMTKELRGR